MTELSFTFICARYQNIGGGSNLSLEKDALGGGCGCGVASMLPVVSRSHPTNGTDLQTFLSLPRLEDRHHGDRTFALSLQMSLEAFLPCI